ncbi:hypothetical protein ACF1BQ_029970 [Bradyrhizobium sp. RDT10]
MTIKGPQAFPTAEYLRRLGAVKSETAKRDVDTLLVTRVANTTYLPGNLTKITTQRALVVSVRDEEPTFIVRHVDQADVFHQTFLECANVVGIPKTYGSNRGHRFPV